ncbi:hypothetical protein ACXGXA_24635, partial [Salmonella enterica subsp. enterica serovar Infantis]
DGVRGARRYLDHLKMEYAFWMDGAESLALNQAYRHVVRMPDGIVPLYVGMANHEQADRLANVVRSRLLTPGGIMATEYETGEQ